MLTLNDGNLASLLGFLVACNGKAYSWKRLKIAIYALSEGGKRESKGLVPLFSYRFNGDCYAGPDDNDLRDDLDWLRDAGFVNETTQALGGAYEHNLYELTDKGRELGQIAVGSWNADEAKSVLKVAKFFRNDTNSVMKLLGEFAVAWDNSQAKTLKKL